MSLDSVIEKYDEYLYPDMDLSELVKTISASRRDVFPVVDRQHRLVGIIYLDDVRPIMFRQELYHRFQIGQLDERAGGPPEHRRLHGRSAAHVRQDSGLDSPGSRHEGTFMGFIRKSHVLTLYRKTLADLSERLKTKDMKRKKNLKNCNIMGTPEFAVESLKCLVEGG